MPVDFLGDAEVAAYGRFVGVPSVEELERFCFLDDVDRALIDRRREDHARLGFAVQLTTVRAVGAFLADPAEVPSVVVDYLAGQLGISDGSCLAAYSTRRTTRFEHAEQIRRSYSLVSFGEVAKELEVWIDARAWTTGDGPTALFVGSVGWLRDRRVVLPGLTTLTRLVARVREEALERLWDRLCDVLTVEQRTELDDTLTVGDGTRVSALERWRRGPVAASGRGLERALRRVAEIDRVGLVGADFVVVVPHRRLVEVARYGMSASASHLRRHLPIRRLATLAATVVELKGRAIDDCLELFDLVMVTELLGKAERVAENEKLRRHASLVRASTVLASAVGVLLDPVWGPDAQLAVVLAAINAIVDRSALHAAHEIVVALAPGTVIDEDADMRAALATRIATVSGFARLFTEVIEFDANPDGQPVLDAACRLPVLLGQRRPLSVGDIDESLVRGSWRPLVFAGDDPVDRDAYVLCVLTLLHRHLKRRDIFAPGSTRWRDPRAQLLSGPAWTNAKPVVCAALDLPDDPDRWLAGQSAALDAAYQDVVDRLPVNSAVTVDDDGRVHVERLHAIEEPASLIALRRELASMLPKVDLPEVILEVMSWEPRFLEAFTAVSGGQSRLDGLHTTIAACLTVHALNIGFEPIVKPDVEALERDRISHVNQTYLNADTYTAANRWLVDAQRHVPLARLWGGGHVAAIDGMRFVVPIPTIYARPNRKYFGARRGVTWLNMINDQAAGLAAKVVSGTARDSLHMIDVIFNHDPVDRPEIIVTDTGSYSDIVFGLVHLLGLTYRPALADIPDQKLWRTNPDADYGPLNTAARGRIDLDRIRRHWDDIVRVVASIHTGTVRAYDVITMLQRDGNPTALGHAIAACGRIPKTLHLLSYLDDDTYRRDIKAIRNLQEGRHALASWIFHGKKGELYQRYQTGMEDQLGALGLVLNCVVLWNTVYLDLAVTQLRAAGEHVNDDDLRRISPLMRRHHNVHGHYSFALPELPTGRRELRPPDPTADDA